MFRNCCLPGRYPKWFDEFDLENDSSPKVQLLLEACIVRLFAGRIADEKYSGRRPPRHSYSHDYETAWRIASNFAAGETLNACLHYLFLRSRDLVNTRWREIGFVAEALIERRGLTRADVTEAIDQGFGFQPLDLKRPAASGEGDGGKP